MQISLSSGFFSALVFTAILSTLLGACNPSVMPSIAVVTPLPAVAQAPVAAVTSTPLREQAQTTPPAATPTPLNLQLPSGSAAAIAMSTDTAMKPEIDEPIQFNERPVEITFDEFYAKFDMRKGLTLSDKLMSLDGVDVVMQGYMAPPLKPELDWFVLTRIRLEVCPFCSSGADWPLDIAVVYVNDSTVVATQAPVRIEGRMEVGNSIDPETGMVSLVRIYADNVENLRY